MPNPNASKKEGNLPAAGVTPPPARCRQARKGKGDKSRSASAVFPPATLNPLPPAVAAMFASTGKVSFLPDFFPSVPASPGLGQGNPQFIMNNCPCSLSAKRSHSPSSVSSVD